jgi:PHP family Zn ribbon phosphoesterase
MKTIKISGSNERINELKKFLSSYAKQKDLNIIDEVEVCEPEQLEQIEQKKITPNYRNKKLNLQTE